MPHNYSEEQESKFKNNGYAGMYKSIIGYYKYRLSSYNTNILIEELAY